MHVEKRSWQPAVGAPCAEMLTIMTSSGTPAGTTVLHVQEHPATASSRAGKTS